MSVKSSFKCIYSRHSRISLGYFVMHAVHLPLPVTQTEKEKDKDREDEAGLRCQTVYRSSSGDVDPAGNEVANCCVKNWRERERDPTEDLSQSVKERRSPWGPDLGRVPIHLLLSRVGNNVEHLLLITLEDFSLTCHFLAAFEELLSSLYGMCDVWTTLSTLQSEH